MTKNELMRTWNWARPRLWVHWEKMHLGSRHQGIDFFWSRPFQWGFVSKHIRFRKLI